MWELLLLLGVGIIIYHMFNQWADGSYGCLDAGLLSFFLILLLLSTFYLAVNYSPVLALVPVAATGIYFYITQKNTSTKVILRKKVQQCRAMILRDPRNPIFYDMLADILYELEDLDGAIFQLTRAIRLGAGDLAQKKLERWTLRWRVLNEGLPVCRYCETENPPGTSICEKCGFELPYDSSLSLRLFAGKKTQKVLVVVLVAMVVGAISALLMGFGELLYIPIGFGLLSLWGWKIVNETRT